MSVVRTKGGKDYLSALPNEILQHIYDLAHNTYRPKGALTSKRILPIYEKTLYREIRIETPSRLSCLLRTLDDRPELAQRTELVEFELYTAYDDIAPLNLDDFLHLLSFVPSLEILWTEWYIEIPTNTLASPMVSKLRTVQLPVSVAKDLEVKLDTLSWIVNIPSITKLNLGHWYIYDDWENPINWTLPQIRTLLIDGFGVTNLAVSIIINACTSLESLTLWSTPGSNDPDITFDEVLLELYAIFESLTFLSLSSMDRDVAIGESIASFPHLVHLRLDGLLPQPELESALAQLVSLTHLELSDLLGFDWDTLVPLLTGSSRLPHLKQLSLGSIYGKIGRRFDPSNSLFVSQFEMSTYDDREGWEVRDICRHPLSYWIKLRRVSQIAQSSGIKINDSFEKGIKILSAYLLEGYNLAIADAYYQMNLRGIHKARKLASEFGMELPELDFACCYPDEYDSELVKVEMEGMGWFALTLRDKEEKDEDKDMDEDE